LHNFVADWQGLLYGRNANISEKIKFGNAATNNLRAALETVPGIPVIKFMAPLTLKIGNLILLLLEDGSINISHVLVSGPDKNKNVQHGQLLSLPMWKALTNF
jgi:hypothetical protein